MPSLQRSAADVGEAVGEENADDLLRAVHHVPVRHARGLLFAAVTHGGEDDEGGLARGLEDAEQGADDD